MPVIDDIATVFEHVCVRAMEEQVADYLSKLASSKGGTTDPEEIASIEDDLGTLLEHAGNWPYGIGLKESIGAMCKRLANHIADSGIFRFGTSISMAQIEELMTKEVEELLKRRGEPATCDVD